MKVHPIKRYCVKRGLLQREFADVVGYTEGFISQLILSQQVCGRLAAKTISEKTGGEISIAELIVWEPGEGVG